MAKAHCIERLTFYSHWIGFANPPKLSEKWTATLANERVEWRSEPSGQCGTLPSDSLTPLMSALGLPPVLALNPSKFDLPAGVIEGHFGSMWTDDHPTWLMRIQFADGRTVELTSSAQHAYMLPIHAIDSDREKPFDTYEPALATAIASLLPYDFLNKGRLSGHLLISDSSDREHDPLDEPAVEEIDQRPPLTAEESEAVETSMMAALFGEERPADKAEAERTGKISKRLLMRLPARVAIELIAQGADVNVADDVGQTALMIAAFPPFNQEKFRALATAGANVEARRNDGLTGLHIACAGGMSIAAEEWVRAGADVHVRCPEKSTPLMLGARWPQIVSLLLASGADPNAADKDGHTPLAYGVIQQCWVSPEEERTALRHLLEAGADPNRADKEGRTPTDHARLAVKTEELHLETMLALSGRSAQELIPDIFNKGEVHARSLLSILREFGGK